MAQQSLSFWVSVTFIRNQEFLDKLKSELQGIFNIIKDELNVPLRNTSSVVAAAHNLDQNQLSLSLKVTGAGGIGYGVGANKIPYQLSLAIDHVKGEGSTTINDDSKDLIKFKEALDFVKDERQVIILLENFTKESARKEIAGK